MALNMRHTCAMDLTPYVQSLREELLAVAGTGDEAATAQAERLVAAVVSATRLAMLDVLSAAADEITRDLVPGSVEVRLRGRNPSFVVSRPTYDEDFAEVPPPADPAEPADAPPTTFDGAVGRINFRPPEQLKAQIEAAAGREGTSVNAWLVKAAVAALNPRAQPGGGRRDPGPNRHFVGWVG
jgi:hypothetical protein